MKKMKSRKNNYLYQNINDTCNTNNLTNNDIINLGKTFGIENPDISTICKQISFLFDKRSKMIANLKCFTEETLIGTPVKELHPMFFYSFNEGNKLYCGDIREFAQLEKNPWTRTEFDNDTKRDINNNYAKIQLLFKNTEDQDELQETVQESITMTINKAMSHVLQYLRYPNNVEHYINANSDNLNLFVNELTGDGILTENEKKNLNTIDSLPNRKLALANALNLKLSNDTTIVNGLSSLRVTLEEIYNKYFTN
jgi:hypothetical protein